VADHTADDHKMPLLDHLIELRQRLLRSVVALLVAFLVCFFFAEEIFGFLQQPLATALENFVADERARRMIFTNLTEVFFTYVKVAFFAGAFIACPIFLTQWRRGSTRTRGAPSCPTWRPRRRCFSSAGLWSTT
jgi:sec-independent protein translocase protein TatC